MYCMYLSGLLIIECGESELVSKALLPWKLVVVAFRQAQHAKGDSLDECEPCAAALALRKRRAEQVGDLVPPPRRKGGG